MRRRETYEKLWHAGAAPGSKGACERCEGFQELAYGLCKDCFVAEKEAIAETIRTRREASLRHGQIIGLLMGNPVANAAERLRHLRIEELLA